MAFKKAKKKEVIEPVIVEEVTPTIDARTDIDILKDNIEKINKRIDNIVNAHDKCKSLRNL